MVEIVCEVVVKEEARGQFELAYGPGGAWSELFAGCPGFRGTTLLKDTHNPRRYLVIDLWDTAEQKAQALADRSEEFSRLDAAFQGWTEVRAEVSTFRILAEATVRPRGSVRQMRTGESRRRGRRTHR